MTREGGVALLVLTIEKIYVSMSFLLFSFFEKRKKMNEKRKEGWLVKRTFLMGMKRGLV